MSELNQLFSDSDSNDQDYIPSDAELEKSEISEVSDSGSDEANGAGDSSDGSEVKGTKKSRPSMSKNALPKKGKKRVRKSAKARNNSKKIPKTDVDSGEELIVKAATEEDNKKKADSLWADFLKDTTVTPKAKAGPSTSTTKVDDEEATPKAKAPEKVKITEVFQFAGEEVKIEKEVSVESTISTGPNETKVPKATEPRRSGISSMLSKIGKKNKLSTLEKSKLDWNNFKKEENLEEEIVNFNRGKDGYLERQDFLQRADLRQFEIEKQLRNSNRRSAR